MGSKRKLLSRRASFLKVLDGDFSKKLTIPRAFIKNFNGDIPQWFILEIVGSRKGWRVDTEEDENGRFYLNDGWNEFVEEQSLQVGDFLLFEYEQPLLLQVKIFEKDGTEKVGGTNFDFEYEVEGSGWREQCPKTQRLAEADLWSTSPFNQHEGRKKSQDGTDKIEIKTDYQYGIHEKHLDAVSKIEMETDYGYGMLDKQCDINDTATIETDNQCREHEKQKEAEIDRFERVTGKVFSTEQGVCYTFIWRRVPHMYYYLTIPRAVVMGKTLSNDEQVILKDREGSTWSMKLRLRPGGRVDLVKGWKEFLMDNDVRNGDILTFEFVSDKVIQIHIDRAIKQLCEIDPPYESAYPVDPPFERACPIDPPYEKAYPVDPPFERACPIDPPYKGASKREPIVSFGEEQTEDYTTTEHNVPEMRGKTESVFFNDLKGSSFCVTCKHAKKVSYLHIPKAIAVRQMLKNKDTVVVCDPEGTQWPMQVRQRPSDGRFGLGQGWNTFWTRHKISYGDTLTFEFVSDRRMKVNIVRA